jgi:hypothetical protein
MEAKPTTGREAEPTAAMRGRTDDENRRKNVPERGEGIVGGETIPSLDQLRNGGGFRFSLRSEDILRHTP